MGLFDFLGDIAAPAIGAIGGGLIGGPPGAMVGLGIGSSAVASENERRAASQAADAQLRSAQIASDLQRYMYDTSRQDYAPYRQAGYEALPQQRRFADLFSGAVLDPNQFVKSPAFNFNLNEGIKAIERSAASRGKLDSTGNLKNLMSFGQGLASNEYQQYLNNLIGSANVYGGIAGTGQTATQNLSSLGANLGSNLANIQLGAGQAQAGGIINQANARTGLYSNLSNIGSNAMDQYMFSKLLGYGGGSSGGFLPDIPNYSYVPRTSLTNPYGSGFGE